MLLLKGLIAEPEEFLRDEKAPMQNEYLVSTVLNLLERGSGGSLYQSRCFIVQNALANRLDVGDGRIL